MDIVMKNKRLFWNFEYQHTQNFNLDQINTNTETSNWEVRYFWQENEIIELTSLPENCFELSRYIAKHRVDEYIINPNNNDNIKIRKNRLVYKPLLAKHGDLYHFGKKIPQNINTTQYPHIVVHKETLHYKCSSDTRLEFTRFCLGDNIFFSFAITSVHAEIVEQIRKHVNPHGLSCSYIEFLKNKANHD